MAIEGLTVERRTDPLGIDRPEPRFAWRDSNASQVACQLQVVDTDNANDTWSAPTWDSGRVQRGDSTYVAYGGPPLVSRHRHSWRVRTWSGDVSVSEWSAPAVFEMGLLSAADWSGRWIAHVVPDLVSEPEDLRRQQPVPALRRKFSLSSVPRRARLYITALGLYEAYVNGTRVGDERLAPGWTDYNKRRDAAPAHRRQCWLNDLQMRERTDLRNEPRGWTSVDFDDSGWDPVSLRAAPGSRLVASRDDGVHVVETLPATSVHAAGRDRHIVDLGANAAGVVRLTATGTPGQHIVIRHAEALDASGELYTENLRGAEQQDEFILADTAPVSLEPQFTFHGFRYAEVSGVPAPLAAEDIESRVLSSATRLVGAFSCSDPLVDTLQRNIVTSLRANFISIPTDCPQRNERLGWTADLQIFAPTALFNADVTNMIDKWLDDLVDTQLPSGAYADIAPAPSGWAGAGNTAWSGL